MSYVISCYQNQHSTEVFNFLPQHCHTFDVLCPSITIIDGDTNITLKSIYNIYTSHIVTNIYDSQLYTTTFVIIYIHSDTHKPLFYNDNSSIFASAVYMILTHQVKCHWHSKKCIPLKKKLSFDYQYALCYCCFWHLKTSLKLSFAKNAM